MRSRIDHITVHLHSEYLHDSELLRFLNRLGFREIKPDARIEKGWDVRWFATGLIGPKLHLVADDDWPYPPEPGLSHFCIEHVGRALFNRLSRGDRYLEHYTPGSPRLWLNYHGLRIEVRV